LIDAETRLNPAASAAYFGAGSSPSGNGSDDDTTSNPQPPSILPPDQSESVADPSPLRLTEEFLANIAQLNADDQSLSKLQVLCPITEEPLGSMGIPLKIIVDGEPVMICCEGCKDMALRNAADTTAIVNRWKAQNAKQPSE
jgi:hypothetical protein